MSDELIQPYPYSVKIERTAKGARFTIHVYNKEKEQAMTEATAMYIALGRSLEEQG
jgi:hypothetical protein